MCNQKPQYIIEIPQNTLTIYQKDIMDQYLRNVYENILKIGQMYSIYIRFYSKFLESLVEKETETNYKPINYFDIVINNNNIYVNGIRKNNIVLSPEYYQKDLVLDPRIVKSINNYFTNFFNKYLEIIDILKILFNKIQTNPLSIDKLNSAVNQLYHILYTLITQTPLTKFMTNNNKLKSIDISYMNDEDVLYGIIEQTNQLLNQIDSPSKFNKHLERIMPEYNNNALRKMVEGNNLKKNSSSNKGIKNSLSNMWKKLVS